MTRDVYRRGDGPGVIVIPELPGITPAVIGFADRVVELGCAVAIPQLFGIPGRAALHPQHDEPGHPTRDALDLVLDLFRRQRLETP